MKLIVITTKNEFYKGLLNRCCCSKSFEIENNDDEVVDIYYFEDINYIVCIPPVTIEGKYTEKANYSVDLVIKSLKHLKELFTDISKNDIYLFLHSGDYFAATDVHRSDGLLDIDWLINILEPDLLEKISNDVNPAHIYQFRHTTTEDVWAILSQPSCEQRYGDLINIVENLQ